MTFRQDAEAAFARVAVGDSWTFVRTFTEADVAIFVGVTGDWNPIHIDDTFSRSGPFKARIVPGLLTGSMLTHIGGLLGWIATEMSFCFRLPVMIGSTVTCTLVITAKDVAARRFTAAANFIDDDGRLVATGVLEGFPTRIRLERDAKQEPAADGVVHRLDG